MSCIVLIFNIAYYQSNEWMSTLSTLEVTLSLCTTATYQYTILYLSIHYTNKYYIIPIHYVLYVYGIAQTKV